MVSKFEMVEGHEMDGPDTSVRSVVRAIAVLFAVVRGGPSNLADLCTDAQLSKATGHRLLQTLAHGELVIQEPASGRYVLGPGALAIAEGLLQLPDGIGHGLLVRPELERLRSFCDETVVLHVRWGDSRICIGESASRQPLRYTKGVGAIDPIFVGAAGKLLLAFMPQHEREELLDRILIDGRSSGTVAKIRRVSRELERIQERGFAMSRGEGTPGAAAVSVPVRWSTGGSVAALSVFAPDRRLSEDRMAELVPELGRSAGRVTRLASSLATGVPK